MEKQPTRQFTIEEYLLREEAAEYKSEYAGGKVQAMSGGSIDHSIIGSNINAALNNAISSQELDCIAFNSEIRIFIEEANSFVYPDAMVTCEKIKTYSEDQHSVINPMLIVEVLSDSTERYDRGDKFHKYCSLPAFREYVLIDQHKPVVDVLYR